VAAESESGSRHVSLCLCSADYTVEEHPSEVLLFQELESGRPKPLVFVLNANLLAMVKMVNCTFLFFLPLLAGSENDKLATYCT